MTKEKTTEEQKARYRSRSKVAVAARSLSPEPGTPNPESEPKITNMFTHGSHGGIDDEYYINELMGLDDFTYEDWIGDKRLGEQQREEIARKYFYKERADKEKK